MSSSTAAANVSPLPTIGRGSTTPRKTSANAASKVKGKPNGSILAFFKKAEQIDEDALFVQGPQSIPQIRRQSSIKAEDVDDHELRYNESGQSNKRRKMSQEAIPDTHTISIPDTIQQQQQQQEQTAAPGTCSPPPPEVAGIAQTQAAKTAPSSRSGPFIEDSDDEDEQVMEQRSEQIKVEGTIEPLPEQAPVVTNIEETESAPPDLPATLSRQATSMGPTGDFADFENMDDFDDDVYDEGEEFVERRWMEEQALLEAEDGPMEDYTDENDSGVAFDEEMINKHSSIPSKACPICNAGLDGISDQDASVHVNNCLDGNPTPLPVKEERSPSNETVPQKGSAIANRFRRPVREPKPGQENPFSLGCQTGAIGGSAFSKLMSGHAEDAAWATAAAAEHAARGKPAYQRTCPFYKILPGFNICVDAFRYGAVKGCKAYFLSHFHSDHYIGLTSSWSHGPIYCSHVTANLVRQQLRVDPKWVIDLEFEDKVEVPGSNGVFVTMIPANHCPGSSLYLFEKVVGKGSNTKSQRVLHCGDFRACRAHVEHPLLRPDVLDAVSGKNRQQKIDVCYLDTTYLNPKYAFPSQNEVIKACADMCVSLNKVRTDENDGWEQMKRERAGAGMVKFVRKDSDPVVKKEEEEDDVDCMKVAKTRGKLLVIVGTYSIGKERICLGIAKALNSKIYAPPGKQRICACLEDPELNARLTSDPREAQVHMTPLFEIRAETLDDYLKDYRDHFSRAVGFRPSGWNYRPPNSRFVESPSVQTVLHSDNWKSSYSMKDLVPQRGSSSRASCFGVPYSEHSSFRELTMFCCALRIDKIIPTVNVGNQKSRERMKAWCERWAQDRKKNGLFKLDGDKQKW